MAFRDLIAFRVTADPSERADRLASRAGVASALRRVGRQLRRLPPLLVSMVLVPGALAAIYCFVLASPIYVSKAQFVVRAPMSSQPQPNGIAAMLQGVGLSPAETDSFILHDYAMSHDAIADLEARYHLRDILSRPGSDFLSRFPRPMQSASLENLVLEYPRFVGVDYNSSTGISTIEVKAFRAKDAQTIATALLDGGELVINRLNDRADEDAVAETQRQIVEAGAALAQAEQRLTAFRDRERLIDPIRSSAVNLDLMGKLQSDIATLRAERAGIAKSAPESPQLPSLDSRIQAYEQQAQNEQTSMAGQAGSLAPMIGEYERLTLERDFAGKTVAEAATAAEEARLEARRKRLYLERISSPSLPDAPTEPHRFNNFMTVLVSLLLAYGSVTLLLAGFREHRRA